MIIVLLCLALGAVPGAAVTRYLLGGKTGGLRIVGALAAGIAAGTIVSLAFVAASGLLGSSDFVGYALMGTVAGPAAMVSIALRWRPEERPEGDMRNS
jgi:hypothetical protein